MKMLDKQRLSVEFPKYKAMILKFVENKIYAYERYGIEFSSLLLYSDRSITQDVCRDKIRKSDQIHQLEENLYLVIYDVISPENSFTAAQHLLHHYQKYYLRQEISIALATAGQDDTAIDMASRLILILEHALKESITNTVYDITQMRL